MSVYVCVALCGPAREGAAEGPAAAPAPASIVCVCVCVQFRERELFTLNFMLHKCFKGEMQGKKKERKNQYKGTES